MWAILSDTASQEASSGLFLARVSVAVTRTNEIIVSSCKALFDARLRPATNQDLDWEAKFLAQLGKHRQNSLPFVTFIGALIKTINDDVDLRER